MSIKFCRSNAAVDEELLYTIELELLDDEMELVLLDAIDEMEEDDTTSSPEPGRILL